MASLALVQPAYSQCDVMRLGNRTSTTGMHIDSDNDASSSHITHTRSDGNRCSSATIVGALKYADAEDDVTDIPFGGHAVFRERTAGEDRELTITRGQAGDVLHLYRRNGVASEFDNDARRWLAGFLPSVLMEAGVNVGPRVARWRSRGGVDNVLLHITDMNSSGARRAHYEQLMAGERLPNADLDRVVRHAGRNIASSGDLRAILERAAPPQGGGGRSGSALEEAVMHIASSGDRTAVLERYGQTTDRQMLLAIMRVARTIPSSGDKSSLMQQLASAYLTSTDRDLNASFFQTAMTVPSSGDLRNVLSAAIPYAGRSAAQALMLIEASRSIASSGDRSDVLIALVNTGVTRTALVREALFDVTSSVASSGDRNRVLEAAARHK